MAEERQEGTVKTTIQTASGKVRTRFEEVVSAVKPKFRGWIHLGMFPISIALGIILISLAPTTAGKVTSAIFALTSAMLFGCSALYHRRTWSPRVTFFLRRLDHSNIFLIIAGTYTPIDRKSTRLNSSHVAISYAVFC